MLFAPTLADRAILPTAWRGRYFFNRIGQQRPVCPANESVPNLSLGSSSIAGCARDPLSGST
ncbi:hypothetical protein AO985_31015 [Pseudomonas aeruginosa]|nr:hypothetical protein AO985_31015 [Pseudomonas aeruginosa]